MIYGKFIPTSVDWRASLRSNSRRTVFVIALFLAIYLCLGLLVDMYIYSSQYPNATVPQLFENLVTFVLFPWATLIMVNVALAPFGGLLALLSTHTNLSVSSGVGFLALFGVSVQTGVIMLEYINQLRARGHTVEDSAVEGAVLRLRPIMMTMLVATLGLLPAATSHGIGSDSQRPFAIVIVGGLIADLAMSIFLLPTIYVWIAGDHDILPEREGEFDEEV